jgi:hypothetical protein
MAFFREHGFAFDHFLSSTGLKDASDDFIVVLGGFGPMNVNAFFCGFAFKFQEKVFNVIPSVGFDIVCLLTQVFPLRKAFGGFIPFAAHKPKGFVVPLGVIVIFLELRGVGWMTFHQT